MAQKPTKRVLWPEKFGDRIVIVDEADYDPDVMEIPGEVPEPEPEESQEPEDEQPQESEDGEDDEPGEPAPYPSVKLVDLPEEIADATPEELREYLEVDPRVGAREVYEDALAILEATQVEEPAEDAKE